MSEKSDDLKNGSDGDLPPLFPGEGEQPGRALVLGAMKIEGGDNETLLVSCKVDQFTIESVARPGEYEKARGYVSLLPEDLWVHVPVHRPGRMVTEAGNVEILGAVFRTLARELDLAVFRMASERQDMRTAESDLTEWRKQRRFDAGKGGPPTRKEVDQDVGEVL